MSRVALELGETSIDRAKITPTPDGGYRMQWSMRLLNGRLIKKTTKGKCTKGELRRRAHAQAEEILATGGGSTPWKGSSSMRDYIRKEVIPGIERTDDSILRPRTRDKYCHVLNLAAEAFEGFRIADAVRPRNLEGILEGIARRHGTSTAKHCQKTVSKYVLEPLVRDEVIAHNPLKSFKPRLPECRMTNKAPGGQALTPEERERVLEYLLAIDLNDVNPPKRGRYTVEDVRNLRRAVVEITLLQAVTGLRINNAQHAIKKLYHELADALGIPLLDKVSTHVWRATLNTEWMQKGVPDLIRSAYFGHSPEVNRSYYTDTTNVSVLVDMLRTT